MRNKALLTCMVLFAQLLLGGPFRALAADVGPRVPQGLHLNLGNLSQLDKETSQTILSVFQKLEKTLILERTRGAKDVDVYRKAAPGVVLVATKDGLGSGVIIDAKGHVITNWHVVKSYRKVLVAFKPKDGEELKRASILSATVEKVDEVTDLALLRINNPTKSFTYLKLGNMSGLAVGQDVHAIGHPQGETWTYTKGIISQIRNNYEWSGGDGPAHRAKVIQTQTPINPGNSGGPLLDDNRRVIGINSFFRQGRGSSYAVAVDEVKKFLQRKQSRTAPSRQSPSITGGKLRCPETYDSTGKGRKDIVGCYNSTSAPPPDFWFIFRASNQQPAYAALGSLRKLQINTVITGQDEQWQTLAYHVDADCNGTVDLIGYQGKGSKEIDRYRRPGKTLLLRRLAKELDGAFKRRKIPYSKLRVCQ